MSGGLGSVGRELVTYGREFGNSSYITKYNRFCVIGVSHLASKD